MDIHVDLNHSFFKSLDCRRLISPLSDGTHRKCSTPHISATRLFRNIPLSRSSMTDPGISSISKGSREVGSQRDQSKLASSSEGGRSNRRDIMGCLWFLETMCSSTRGNLKVLDTMQRRLRGGGRSSLKFESSSSTRANSLPRSHSISCQVGNIETFHFLRN